MVLKIGTTAFEHQNVSKLENNNSLPKQGPEFSRRQKIATTFAIYLGNICMGLSMTAYGPALVDFTNKFGVNVDEVTIVFTIQTVGYLVGCVLTSFIYNFFSRQLGVIIGLTGMALGLYLTPQCESINALYVVGSFLGVCHGMYGSSQIVWVMEMWENEAGPYMQAQHFFYSVGALVPSILLSPFLSKESYANASSTTRGPYNNELMWIPFTIIGFINTVAVVVHIYFYKFQPYSPPPKQAVALILAHGQNNKKLQNGFWADNPKTLKVVLIILAAIFEGLYTGTVMVSNQYVPSFAQYGEQNLSEKEGAQVMTAYTAFFAAGRGIGILANFKIPSLYIVAFNLIALFVSNTMLITIGNSDVGLWLGVILLGIGFSTINPSFDAYMIRHVEYTNAISGFLLVCGSVLSSLFAFVVGQQLEANPNLLFYINLSSTATITVAVLIILKLTHNRPLTRL